MLNREDKFAEQRSRVSISHTFQPVIAADVDYDNHDTFKEKLIFGKYSPFFVGLYHQ